MGEKETVWVVTGEPLTRSSRLKELAVEDLAVNVNVFLAQMDRVLEQSPDNLGKFQFVEFEVHAEVTAKGTLAILGTGGEAGASGGIKFVFRRSQDQPQ